MGQRQGDVQTTPAPTADAAAAREDRVLAGAAIMAVVVATFLVPLGGAELRSAQAYVVAIPAALAATVAWARGERRIFAPPAALVVAVAISGVLALALGTPWTFGLGAAALILGNWLPWPRWRTEQAATAVLWALAIAPLVVIALAQVAGWSNPVRDLVLGGRVHTAPRIVNLNAMALLWSVLACEVVARRATSPTAARVIQAVALVLLGATGSRVVALAAGAVLAVLVWRDRRAGLQTIVRDRWAWALYALALIPRVLGRTFGGAATEDLGETALSGRGEVWSVYLDQGAQYLWTGGGIGRAQTIMDTNPVLAGRSTHNEYLWLAISVGILGLVLVAAAWVVAFRARTSWVLPDHPELLAPAAMLPVMGLVEDPLLAVTFVQPYLILLAASARDRASSSTAS